MFEQNVGAMYDQWLLDQADRYCSPCEPKIVGSHQEYEGTNEDGSIEYSTEAIYNCEDCDETDCEYWKEYNLSKWEELQKEKELEDEIA